jgi:hypothetical protein
VRNGRLPILNDQIIPSVQINYQNNVVDFFNIRGIVHYEFVPTGETVNQVYYLKVLQKPREKVRQKLSELFANNSRILQHDNATAHTALCIN